MKFGTYVKVDEWCTWPGPRSRSWAL